MNKIKEINDFVTLYDLYNHLLTKIQKEDFEMYLFDDFSLEEIAKEQNKSKAAVHDNIKRTKSVLNDYEKKLKLYEKELNLNNLMDNINDSDSITEIKKLIKKYKGE